MEFEDYPSGFREEMKKKVIGDKIFTIFHQNISEIDGNNDEFDLLLVSHESRVERPREDVSVQSEF